MPTQRGRRVVGPRSGWGWCVQRGYIGYHVSRSAIQGLISRMLEPKYVDNFVHKHVLRSNNGVALASGFTIRESSSADTMADYYGIQVIR